MKKTPLKGHSTCALVVDDEPSSRMNIRDALAEIQVAAQEAGTGEEALQAMKDRHFDVVLLDIRMPGLDGLSVLTQIIRLYPNTPVIIFTAYGTSDRAIEAMKMGAFDYLTKPFDLDEFFDSVRRAIEYKTMSQDVQRLRHRLAEAGDNDFRPDQFVSGSAPMQRILKLIGKVAPSTATVLIEGETGTGKELVANALWFHSTRREKPFIKVNCASIPENLLESELFGHEKGAFTDAHIQRKGYFEIADGGTLFLDEVSEMSTKLQSKLLRVLEQHEFQRVGGGETLRVDVRIIAATNRNLQEETRQGRFRQDVYFRLKVVHIMIPPLRDRRDDIPQLARFFIAKYGKSRNLVLSDEAMSRLVEYSWPGNVRELENVLERAAVIAQGDLLTPDQLSLSPTHRDLPAPTALPEGDGSGRTLREILQNVERRTILEALIRSHWNKTKTAKLLGIDRRILFEKIKTYKLVSEDPSISK